MVGYTIIRVVQTECCNPLNLAVVGIHVNNHVDYHRVLALALAVEPAAERVVELAPISVVVTVTAAAPSIGVAIVGGV